MKNCILCCKKDGYYIIGNINIVLQNVAQIQILSPYYGFELQATSECYETASEQELTHAILRKTFEICRILQEQHQEIRTDFLTLMETLEKFNNKNTEDYQRNRNELMKVFMNRFFQPVEHASCKHIYERDAIFNFLAGFFIKNGKTAKLNITTLYVQHAPPPQFDMLESLLKDYFIKTESEKIELLAEQILTRKKGKYDWFIQQEFLQENQGLTEESN